MQKYEYMVVAPKFKKITQAVEELNEQINAMAKEGWRLVCAEGKDIAFTILYFERAI